MLKSICFVLFVFMFVNPIGAQWDSIKYKDGRELRFQAVITSGDNLPSTWISIGVIHAEVMVFGKKRSMVSVGTNFSPLQHFSTLYGEYSYAVFQINKLRRSGKVTMDMKIEGNYPYQSVTYYLAKFKNIVGVTNFGLHGGVQRNGYNHKTYIGRIVTPQGIYSTQILATHELDFGISLWSRRGILVYNDKRFRGRFFMFRFCMDAAWYRIARFGIYEGTAGPYSSIATEYEHGQDDPNGNWVFEDLPYAQWGGKVMFDFFWSPFAAKRSRDNLFGFFGRIGAQLVPEAMDGSRGFFFLNVGIVLGSGSRIDEGKGTAEPVPLYK